MMLGGNVHLDEASLNPDSYAIELDGMISAGIAVFDVNRVLIRLITFQLRIVFLSFI